MSGGTASSLGRAAKKKAAGLGTAACLARAVARDRFLAQ
jgi:hypothetical protein